MSDFRRYAVYYLPDDAGLAAFGASWLGWDIGTGTVCGQPNVANIGRLTDQPRKYGFHGTLKPPFRLATGTAADDLASAVADVAKRSAPILLDGLSLTAIGSFLALVPKGDTRTLDRLAFRCVSDLDGFRRPPDAAERDRRRAGGLTQRQEALLGQWGYPYVGDEFRFHLTLTGKLTPDELSDVRVVLEGLLPPLPAPFAIDTIALVGEDREGMFRLIHRYALTG